VKQTVLFDRDILNIIMHKIILLTQAFPEKNFTGITPSF